MRGVIGNGNLTSLEIEFFGDAGRVHNVRFADEKFASNEVILGLFYENVDWLLGQLYEGVKNGEMTPCDFGVFITGSISKEHTILESDSNRISSKSYKVKSKALIEALEKWKKFRSRNQNGIVKTVRIDAEIY